MSSDNLTPVNLLAVDLGGTKVAAALVSRQGQILLRRQVPTCQDGPEAGIAQIVDLLRQVINDSDLQVNEILAVGIGIPAVLEPQSDHIIWAPNLEGWRDVDLRSPVQMQLDLPVFIEYDGHTAVLGEWWMGAGKGYNSCIDIIIGTGIGGGMILEGQLVRGLNRLAGAVGWTVLASQAFANSTTNRSRGHWESLAAGPGIVRRAQVSLTTIPNSKLAQITGGQLTARDVFVASRQGDELAIKIVDETAELIGLGVSNIVSLLNPEIVILGGSVGAQGDLLLPRVREVVNHWAQPISAGSVIITSSDLGTDAGLLGAAYAAILRIQAAENGALERR